MKLNQQFCFSILTLSFILPQIAIADVLSLSAGAGIWSESPSGNFQKTIDPAAVDIEDNLFWDTEPQAYAFITLEHFVPVIPNARLSYNKIDHSGQGNTDFVYDGIRYNGDINNDISIETLDLLLYYEVLDNVVSLDLGLNIRQLSVDFDITDVATEVKSTNTTNETIPMVYALLGFSPLPDLIISGEISYVSYDDSSISDFTAKVAYTTSFFVGIEAGYRSQKYALDDADGTDADLTFEGPFAGAYLKF
jgi:outer membrane protein